MEYVNPTPVDPAGWNVLFNLTVLFLVLPLVAGTGAFLLATAHAITPSLIITRQAPPALVKARPVVYLLAAVFLAGALAIIGTIASQIGFTWQIYPHRWL